MERSCSFSTKKTTYYEAKATWLGRQEYREGNREDKNPPGESSLTAICSMTEQIARLQADTSNRENIKFVIQYIKKEMKIMRLQMASEEEWECTNDARQGKTHTHGSYAAHHHTETTSLGANKEPTATKGERKKTERPVFPCLYGPGVHPWRVSRGALFSCAPLEVSRGALFSGPGVHPWRASRGALFCGSVMHPWRASRGTLFCGPLVPPWRTLRVALFGAPLEGFQGCSLIWPRGAPLEGFQGCSLLLCTPGGLPGVLSSLDPGCTPGGLPGVFSSVAL